MRDTLLKALSAHAHGEIEKHKANVEVYLTHPVGIGEHGDVTEAIQVELDKIESPSRVAKTKFVDAPESKM